MKSSITHGRGHFWRRGRGGGGGSSAQLASPPKKTASTKTLRSHERVKLPKFRNQPQNRLKIRNISLLHVSYEISHFLRRFGRKTVKRSKTFSLMFNLSYENAIISYFLWKKKMFLFLRRFWNWFRNFGSFTRSWDRSALVEAVFWRENLKYAELLAASSRPPPPAELHNSDTVVLVVVII